MKNFLTFETERLILKPTDESDAAFYLELLNTPKWKQNIGDRKVNTLEEAAEYIRTRRATSFLQLGFGNYTVIRKSDQQKIGSCGLYSRDGIEGIDIGFAFLPAYERKGYALESALRIKQAAFETFNLPMICAITIKKNLPSQRLLEKLGLQFIKTIRIPNDEEDLLYYELKNPTLG